jgi:hypothetical protein
MAETGKLGGASGTPIKVNWQIAYPDRSNGAVTIGGQNVLQVCDGKSAWIAAQGNTRDATPFIGEFKRGISLFGGGWGLYKMILAGTVTAQFIGEEQIDGRETQGVAIKAPFGEAKLYFDSQTHLLTAARYEAATPQGPSENEERWGAYRTVGGRQFAFSDAIYRGGSLFLESTIQDLQVNPKLQESLFAKPQPQAAK